MENDLPLLFDGRAWADGRAVALLDHLRRCCAVPWRGSSRRRGSAATARSVLGDYAGVVLVDGYAAYQTATKSGADGPCPATLAFCWAHVRRKFFEAQPFAPACEEVLELIGELYAIEADLPGWYALTGQVRQAALAHRLASSTLRRWWSAFVSGPWPSGPLPAAPFARLWSTC